MNWRVSIGRSNFVFRFTRSNEKSDPFKRLFLSPTREREREREKERTRRITVLFSRQSEKPPVNFGGSVENAEWMENNWQ